MLIMDVSASILEFIRDDPDVAFTSLNVSLNVSKRDVSECMFELISKVSDCTFVSNDPVYIGLNLFVMFLNAYLIG